MAGNVQTDAADLEDPGSYPPVESLQRECDLVMKGGITSGVIYPRAMSQLATSFRFRNVGGSSAGAIAAAGAAAAELGRSTGSFARLATLAHRLGTETAAGGTVLYNLFQPQPQTRGLYRLAAAFLRRGRDGEKAGTRTKVTRALVAAVRLLRPVPALIFVAPPVALGVAAGVIGGDGGYVGVAAASLLLLLGGGLAVAWSIWQHIQQDLKANSFGLCTGMHADPNRPGANAPMTEWIADQLDDLAGRDTAGPPLTFGDLAAGGIELAMLTTNLTEGTQQKAPFESRVWAYREDQWSTLFPKRVMTAINAASDRYRDSAHDLDPKLCTNGVRPLPPPEDLPAIVGVRMSLSFPALLSAVPMHRIDYRRDGHPLVCHWFSDGGITSNFPLHFFDHPMPSRPTFALNLDGIGILRPDECDNVSLPDSNTSGILAKTRSLESVTDFASLILDSLQNWADNAQTHVPGYRDRIVTVLHTAEEGGTNLDMHPRTVARLANRGACAGATLQNDFDFEQHRWIRYRSFMQALEELVLNAAEGYHADPPGNVASFDAMLNGAPPTAYRSPWRSEFGRTHTEALLAMAAALGNDDHSFADGAPNPRPKLQARPVP